MLKTRPFPSKKSRAKFVETFTNTCLSWLRGFLHVYYTTDFLEVYSKIPPSRYFAALITLSLWLSLCCKWRQDADLKCCLLDLKFEMSCHLSFMLSGEAARWGVSLPPLPAQTSLPSQRSHSRALAAGLYGQELCFPSRACLWSIAGIK